MDADLSTFGKVSAGEFCWNGQTLALPETAVGRHLTAVRKGNIVARGKNGEILAITTDDQKVVWIAGGVNMRGESASHYGLPLSLWTEDAESKRASAPPYARDYLYSIPVAILQMIIGKAPVCKSAIAKSTPVPLPAAKAG